MGWPPSSSPPNSDPTPDSDTSVMLSGEAEFNGTLRLLGPLIEGQFQKQFELEWDNLKRVLEATDPESSAR